MANGCRHLDEVREVVPKADGCQECLATGGDWVHLRLCQSCGHVGCCDSSDGRHALRHARQSGHRIIRSLEEGEAWGWCYTDQVLIPSQMLRAHLPGAGPEASSGHLG